MFVMPNQRGLTWPIRCYFLDAGYLAFIRESRPNVTTIGSLMSIQGLSPIIILSSEHYLTRVPRYPQPLLPAKR